MKNSFNRYRSLAVITILSGVMIVHCGDGLEKLGTAPTGIEFTDADGNPVIQAEAGTLIYVRNADGNIVATFTLNSDADLSGLIAGKDSTVAFAHFPNTDGLTGDITLFVPCFDTTEALYVTPGATSASAVLLDGSDSSVITLTIADAGPKMGYTFANASTRTGTADCELSAAASTFSTGAVGAVLPTPTPVPTPTPTVTPTPTPTPTPTVTPTPDPTAFPTPDPTPI